MNQQTIRTSQTSFLFFNAVPLVAVGFAIAVFVPAPPKSVALIVILLFTAVALRLSNWILIRSSSYAFNEYDFSFIRRTKRDSNDDNDDEDEVEEYQMRQSQRSHHSSGSSRRSNRIPRKLITSIQYFNTIQPLMRPSKPIIVIFYSSILTLILILMVRLFSVDHFGGSPELLDYGPKVSKNGKISDSNIALEEFNFSTVGHVFQGVLATLLTYPAVSGVLAKTVTRVRSYLTKPKYVIGETRILLLKPCVFTLSFLHLLQSFMVYYPFYSMVKRLRYTSFARTSHLNNSTEWVVGTILGISLGSLVSALVQRRLQFMTSDEEDRSEVLGALSVEVEVDVAVETDEETNNNVDNNNDNDSQSIHVIREKKKVTRYTFGRVSEFKDTTEYPLALKIVEVVSILNLILFALTVVLSGLFIGISWNYDEGDKINAGITALYFIIAIVNFALFYFFSLLK